MINYLLRLLLEMIPCLFVACATGCAVCADGTSCLAYNTGFGLSGKSSSLLWRGLKLNCPATCCIVLFIYLFIYYLITSAGRKTLSAVSAVHYYFLVITNFLLITTFICYRNYLVIKLSEMIRQWKQYVYMYNLI